jgi:tetratricopeptide (TPR) repeat protein
MNSMLSKPCFAVAATFGLLVCTMPSARSQQITLKSGQKVDTLGLRVSGDTVMGKVQVGESSGEVGYQIATIARIDFPEPKGLKSAAESLSQGQPDKALAEVEPLIRYYQPFKAIPGAWWAQSALIKVSALAALKRDTEAEPLAQEIERTVSDPEVARAARLRLVTGLVRKQEFDKAAQICDLVIKESTEATVLADAWISKGDLCSAQKNWQDALTAYLHVPVFYPNEKLFMPPALLGSGRAYRRLEDLEHAKRAFTDLVAAFPKSAEAAIAQSELQKLEKIKKPPPTSS